MLLNKTYTTLFII